MSNKLYQIFKKSTGVSIDTRTMSNGALFFALSGPNFDGNTYAIEALQKGAIAAVTDRKVVGCETIVVDDVLKKLQELSTHHRKSVKAKIIALTGSNGKTTTKELIKAVLDTRFITQATPGNLNNHIGVPLSLLSIREDCEIAVIEMGANHRKEIESLCKIALPDFGLITNIGKAHLEGFGGIEGVAKGKLEMFDHISTKKKVFFANMTDERIVQACLSYNHTIPYDIEEFTNVKEMDARLGFLFEGNRYLTNLSGVYNIINISAAIQVANFFKVKKSKALQAICNYIPKNSRSQLLSTKNNRLLLDHYNANPSSVKVALSAFHSLGCKDKVVILGEMAELGEDSLNEHHTVMQLIEKLNFKTVILVGTTFSDLKQFAPNGYLFFKDNTELISFLIKNPPINKMILLKGSRSSSLEELIEYL